MEREAANTKLKEIYHEYTSDISEFWHFAQSIAEAHNNAKERDYEWEQKLPGALGSLMYNPEKLNRFPYSMRVPIMVLLTYEISLRDQMISRYKRFQKRMKETTDKETWKIERLISALKVHSVDLHRGKIIRDLLVHDKGVMNKRTYAEHPETCKTICQIGEEVPLKFDLIYSVHDGLTELNEHLKNMCDCSSVRSCAEGV